MAKPQRQSIYVSLLESASLPARSSLNLIALMIGVHLAISSSMPHPLRTRIASNGNWPSFKAHLRGEWHSRRKAQAAKSIGRKYDIFWYRAHRGIPTRARLASHASDRLKS